MTLGYQLNIHYAHETWSQKWWAQTQTHPYLPETVYWGKIMQRVGSAGDKVMEQNYILLQLKDPERADCTYRALPPAQCRLSIEPLSCRGLGVFLMTQVFPAITNPSPLNPEIQVPASEFRITIFCILSQKENHYQLSNSMATALLQALLYAAGEMHFQYPWSRHCFPTCPQDAKVLATRVSLVNSISHSWSIRSWTSMLSLTETISQMTLLKYVNDIETFISSQKVSAKLQVYWSIMSLPSRDHQPMDEWPGPVSFSPASHRAWGTHSVPPQVRLLL